MFGKRNYGTFLIANSGLPAIDSLVFKNGLLVFLFFITLCNTAFSQEIKITDGKPSAILSASMEQFVDTVGITTPEEVLQRNNFIKYSDGIPIFPNNIKSVWFRFKVQDQSVSSRLFLNIAYPNLSLVTLYKLDSGKITVIGKEGNELPNGQRIAWSPNIVFNLQIKQGSTQQYLLHVYSRHPIIIPATIVNYDALNQSVNFQTVVMGVYLGVLMVMFLYNLFLYFATRDNNYLFYIVYIFFLGFAQTTLVGYEYRYIWPGFPWLNKYAVVFTSSFSAITGLLFSMHFLRTSYYAPRVHKWLQLIVAVYVIGLCYCLFANDLSINYTILNYNGLIGVLSVLATSLYIAKKNFRPAYFYLTAWLFFLISFVILILRNLAILPYNDFTTYIIYVGSSFEVALLSIALADKINVLRMEKEASQAESLKALQANEKLVRDQNIMLEKKVSERTEELSSSNASLTDALQDLKDTQIQLVEAEKMASLGQLTAGIAHEINNPINFVKSNIGPLQLDINDLIAVIDEYEKLHSSESTLIPEKLIHIEKIKKQIDIAFIKTEIENLVKGIREGAERTAEIVQGLRTFSRLDESEIKTVNIHDGLDSTMVLLKNILPANVTVKKEYRANGLIECYPGKLNQVFMNILSNAIQAIKQKRHQADQEYLSIVTKDTGGQIEISIKDTGIGINEEIKRKIYDPFFTTKEVGEGTGLGLSIVYKIIQMHQGKIEVFSEEGKGAEFVITLNHLLPEIAIA
jgi:signal transduction histidine kinase